MHHVVDAGHLSNPVAARQIDKQITHHAPEETKAIDRGERADRFRRKAWVQLIGHRQERIAARFAPNDPSAGVLESLTVQIGIKTAGAMPEHRFLAVLGVFEVDPIAEQVVPEAFQREPLMEETEHGEWIQELFLPLINQILAVSIEHDAVALEHIHHLEQMVRSVLEQRRIAEQTADQFLLIRQRRRLER